MKLIDKLENSDAIKKALEIETKNKYINIDGKTKPFSQFMLGEVRKIVRLFPKSSKWKNMYNIFDIYHLLNTDERKNALADFCELLLEPYVEPEKIEKKVFDTNPETMDVVGIIDWEYANYNCLRYEFFGVFRVRRKMRQTDIGPIAMCEYYRLRDAETKKKSKAK